jgi:hypothetical protein
MNKVIVQKEIKVQKCDNCDEYGRIKTPRGAGYYYPFCSCPFGVYKKQQEKNGDMFYQARHGN